MEKQRLFVDMDGTLAVFTPVDTLEKLYEQGYFINQAPHENVIAAIKDIIRNNPEIEVNILSAYLTDSNYALQEKTEWLEKYLPEIPKDRRIFSPCGRDKKGFVPDGIRDTDVLLDDYTKNLLSWQPPGKGLKLLNGINHTNGTWKNDVVNFNSPTLAKDIIKIFKENELIMQNNITVELTPQQLKDIRYCLEFSDNFRNSQLNDLLHDNSYTFTQKELWAIRNELTDASNSFYGADDNLIENGDADEIERIRFQDSIEDLIDEFGKIHKPDINTDYRISDNAANLFLTEDKKHFTLQPAENNGRYNPIAKCTSVKYLLPEGYMQDGDKGNIINTHTREAVHIKSVNGVPAISDDGHKYYLLENSPMGNKSFECEKKPSIREYLKKSDPKSLEQPKEKSKEKGLEI